MGVSYREELRKTQKAEKRKRFPSRDHRGGTEAAARSKAIQREQGRQAVHLRAKEKAIQGRLLDA